MRTLRGVGNGSEHFDLYVDWLNGNDANTGLTPATALRTLAHCLAAHAVNGNKIGILGGTANNEIYFESGIVTALTGITIKAVPGHTPVFSTGTQVTVFAKTGGRANVWEFACATSFVNDVWWHAVRLTSVADVATCDATPNSYFFDDPGNMIYVNVGGPAPDAVIRIGGATAHGTYNGAGLTLDGITYSWSVLSAIISAASTIRNCTFEHFTAGAARSVIQITGGVSHLIDGCTFDDLSTAYHRAIRVDTAGTDVTIQNCTIEDCYYGISLATGNDHVIYNCTFDNIAYDGLSSVVPVTVSYCVASDCHHAGYIAVGAAASMIANHCVYYTPTVPLQTNWHGFVIENGATAELYHCVAVDCTEDGFYVLVGGATATVYNCAAIGCLIGFKQDNTAGVVTANYNGVYDNTTAYGGSMPWAPGANDVAGDPLMAGLPSDVHVGVGSPYLNAGVFVPGYSEMGPPTDIGRWES